MITASQRQETPLVLIVNAEEWTTRSIESILRPEGYAVLRAFSGAQGVELAARIRPDLVLVAHGLPDIRGAEVCERLRSLPTIRRSTPIVVFSSGFLRRSEEMAALRAGAWSVLTPPFDAEELVARLAPLVAAKRDSDRSQESSFLDPATGFYNLQGFMRRVAEVAADTARSRRPVACVVLGAERSDEAGAPESTEELLRQSTATLGSVLLSTTRTSDSIGRIGHTDFVILAPGTDADGAGILARRILDRADRRAEEHGLGGLDLRAGLYSAESEESAGVVPEEFLRRATLALRESQSEGGGGVLSRIRAFESN